MTTQHTPTPWEAVEYQSGPMRKGEFWIRANGVGIASLDEANAAHIVRCVNAHDELVAALRSIASIIDGQFVDDNDALHVAMNTARAALAKAEGQS